MLSIYILIIVIIIIGLLISYLILTHNKLINLENEIKKEYLNIDINLKKRSDLIPNLVDVVNKHMKHEKELLTKLVETRNKVIEAKTEQEIINYDHELSKLLKNVLLIAENHPNLKLSSNFLQLQNELLNVEESLLSARKKYNQSILDYDNKNKLFPIKLFTTLLGLKKYEYFKISNEEKEISETNSN